MLGVFVYAFFVALTLIISIVLLAALKWREEDGKGRVAVIVLGDLGRSPRMQYHALSLCREGYDVEFVGYGGIKCIMCDRNYYNVSCIRKPRLFCFVLAVATVPGTYRFLNFLLGVLVSWSTSRLRVFFTIYGKFRTKNFSLFSICS